MNVSEGLSMKPLQTMTLCRSLCIAHPKRLPRAYARSRVEVLHQQINTTFSPACGGAAWKPLPPRAGPETVCDELLTRVRRRRQPEAECPLVVAVHRMDSR